MRDTAARPTAPPRSTAGEAVHRFSKRKRALCAALMLSALTLGAPDIGANSVPNISAERLPDTDAAFAYGSPAFLGLLSDSASKAGAAGVEAFPAWLEDAYARTPGAKLPGHADLTLPQALAARAAELAAAPTPAARAQLERDTALWLHRAVKAVIPRFSLTRGFEFVNAVRFGERQCLLQSVLIASLLQRMNMPAGVVMVWKNQKAQESNLAHVVTVLQLADGADVLVDASDPTPFMRHLGLFLRVGAPGKWVYRFVYPQYAPDHRITAYRDAATGRAWQPGNVAALDGAYVRSQFDYYRGERAPGGFLGPSTQAGLRSSAAFLQSAARHSADNPLAALVLGHVYRKQGDDARARAQYDRARRLYAADGHVPTNVAAAYTWSVAQPTPAQKTADASKGGR